MSFNGISLVSAYQDNNTSKTTRSVKDSSSAENSKAPKVPETSSQDSSETPPAVYEKSNDESKKSNKYKPDIATINKMKADAEKRTSELRSLVAKLFHKQGQTFEEADMYQLLREGKVPVDDETAAKAKKDISEDGYWGVKQTSDRLVSFAKALTGGDQSKADEMIEAVKKGFEEAKKAWGGELPDICQKTLDATLEKLDNWKSSSEEEASAK